jgi:hypothetical protein
MLRFLVRLSFLLPACGSAYSAAVPEEPWLITRDVEIISRWPQGDRMREDRISADLYRPRVEGRIPAAVIINSSFPVARRSVVGPVPNHRVGHVPRRGGGVFRCARRLAPTVAGDRRALRGTCGDYAGQLYVCDKCKRSLLAKSPRWLYRIPLKRRAPQQHAPS